MENKRILFLLSGNISTTPRAQKVFEYFYRNGIDVDFVLFNRKDSWRQLDEKYLSAFKCRHIYLPFSKKESIVNAVISECLNIIGEKLPVFGINSDAWASSKINGTIYLNKNKIINGEHYNAVIGFSSMLWAAWYLARKMKVPFGFDMEDYHPLENIYHRYKDREIHRRERIFRMLLPQAAFVSYASPLIKWKSDELLAENNCSVKTGMVINNTFLSSEFQFTESHDGKVEFVWFSQTVSYGRGLEQFLPALAQHNSRASLTIIGNMDSRFYDEWISKYKDIVTLKPALSQKELHKLICRYDVGLAIEQTSQSKDNGNRELCLSNKIFAYLLSGDYILATDTPAQRLFVDVHLGGGMICGQSSDSMATAIEKILANIDEIRAAKKIRFESAKQFGWEEESHKIGELLETL